jgi:hypothetical protein
MHAATIENSRALPLPPSEIDLVNRVRGEFLEMPGMRLTFDQAVRLWALDARTCEAVLDRLISVGYLARDDRGHYRKAHGGY